MLREDTDLILLTKSYDFDERAHNVSSPAPSLVFNADDVIQPADAASYIAEMLGPLHNLALAARLASLAKVLQIAQEEAERHGEEQRRAR